MSSKRTFLLLVQILLTHNAFGLSCEKYPPFLSGNPNPMPGGTGMIVGGISLIVLAVPVGIVTGIRQAARVERCDQIDREDCNSGEMFKIGLGTFLGVAALGGTMGGLMIADGAETKRQRREWNSECKAKPSEEPTPSGLAFSHLSLSSQKDHFAVGATFQF